MCRNFMAWVCYACMCVGGITYGGNCKHRCQKRICYWIFTVFTTFFFSFLLILLHFLMAGGSNFGAN